MGEKSAKYAIGACLFLSLARPGIGAVDCPEALHEVGLAVDSIISVVTDGKSTEKEIQEAMAVIHEVNGFLGRLKAVSELDVKLYARYQDPGNPPQSNRLKLTLQYNGGTVDRPLIKHPRYSKIITAHEYGHALFFANTRERLKAMYEDYFAKEAKVDYWLKASDELYLRARQITDEGERVALRNRAKELNTQAYDILKSLHEHYLRVERGAYDELFGDLVAVLYAGDPQAMRKVMSFAGMKETIKYYAGKDVPDAKQHLPKAFPAYQQAVRVRDFTGPAHWTDSWKTPHAVFSPTRKFLGDFFLKNPGLSRGQILDVVLEAIVEEMEQGYANAQSGAKLSPAEANEQLIARLQTKLPARTRPVPRFIH